MLPPRADKRNKPAALFDRAGNRGGELAACRGRGRKADAGGQHRQQDRLPRIKRSESSSRSPQFRIVVFAERRGTLGERRAGAVEGRAAGRRGRVRSRPPLDHAECQSLRVGDDLVERMERAVRDTGGFEEISPMRDRPGRENRAARAGPARRDDDPVLVAAKTAHPRRGVQPVERGSERRNEIVVTQKPPPSSRTAAAKALIGNDHVDPQPCRSGILPSAGWPARGSSSRRARFRQGEASTMPPSPAARRSCNAARMPTDRPHTGRHIDDRDADPHRRAAVFAQEAHRAAIGLHHPVIAQACRATAPPRRTRQGCSRQGSASRRPARPPRPGRSGRARPDLRLLMTASARSRINARSRVASLSRVGGVDRDP